MIRIPRNLWGYSIGQTPLCWNTKDNLEPFYVQESYIWGDSHWNTHWLWPSLSGTAPCIKLLKFVPNSWIIHTFMHLNLLDTVQGTLFKNISQEPNIFRTLFSIKNKKNYDVVSLLNLWLAKSTRSLHEVLTRLVTYWKRVKRGFQ